MKVNSFSIVLPLIVAYSQVSGLPLDPQTDALTSLPSSIPNPTSQTSDIKNQVDSQIAPLASGIKVTPIPTNPVPSTSIPNFYTGPTVDTSPGAISAANTFGSISNGQITTGANSIAGSNTANSLGTAGLNGNYQSNSQFNIAKPNDLAFGSTTNSGTNVNGVGYGNAMSSSTHLNTDNGKINFSTSYSGTYGMNNPAFTNMNSNGVSFSYKS